MSAEYINEVTRKLYIDWECADRITVAILKDAYQTCKAALDDPEYTHPEDLAYNAKLIPALKTVLNYFGESVDAS